MSRRPLSLLGFVLVLSGLAACSGPQRQSTEPGPVASSPADARQLHQQLIQSMLDRRQYYAALAHIEDRRRSGDEDRSLVLLEAEARRSLNQAAAARRLYESLLRSSLAAEAYHGLGLLAASAGRPDEAVRQLAAAVERKPTAVAMRNDLGFALMQQGEAEGALVHLATAAELDPEDSRSRNNLIVLLFLTGDETGARRLAAQAGMDDALITTLRNQAQTLRARRPRVPARPATP